jgi:hypothetical protein
MQSFLRSRKMLAAGAGVATFAAVLGGGVLGGQFSGASPASALGSGASALTSFVQQTGPAPQGTPVDRAAQTEDYLQKLAKNLNIDENTLKAALKQTSLDQLAADVASGKITQAQADQAKTAIDNGAAPLFGPGGFDRGGHGRAGGPGVAGPQDGAALAQFLGIDQATLEQAEHSGASLATIASDHGKNRDQLKTFLTDQETARLKDAVTNGKLTQTQADQMQQRFASNLDARIDGTHTGGPMHHNGGPGRGTPGTQPSTNAN